MKHTVGGPVTTRGVELGGVWLGDPDYSFTSLIVSTIESMNLKKKVVSFIRLCEAVGQGLQQAGQSMQNNNQTVHCTSIRNGNIINTFCN